MVRALGVSLGRAEVHGGVSQLAIAVAAITIHSPQQPSASARRRTAVAAAMVSSPAALATLAALFREALARSTGTPDDRCGVLRAPRLAAAP